MTAKHRLVICSCGWERETVSELGSELSQQLAQMDVAHVTVIEGPADTSGGQQLLLN